jgi:hypothetical protein
MISLLAKSLLAPRQPFIDEGQIAASAKRLDESIVRICEGSKIHGPRSSALGTKQQKKEALPPSVLSHARLGPCPADCDPAPNLIQRNAASEMGGQNHISNYGGCDDDGPK